MEKYIPFNKGAIRPVDCISEGWAILKDKYWLFFLFVLIGIIIIAFIPILRWFLYGPMMVGAYYALLQKSRDLNVSAESFLKGFSVFLQAMILGLIESFFQLLNDIASFFFNFLSLLPLMDLERMGPRRGPIGPSAANALAATDLDKIMAGAIGLVIIIVLVVFVVTIVVSFVWRITFMFALPLMADHPELNAIEAISLGARAGWSNAGGLILLMLMQWVWMLIGVIAFCIGILFVAPVILASDIAAYRMVFPDTEPGASPYSEPPRPDYYQGSFGQGT